MAHLPSATDGLLGSARGGLRAGVRAERRARPGPHRVGWADDRASLGRGGGDRRGVARCGGGISGACSRASPLTFFGWFWACRVVDRTCVRVLSTGVGRPLVFCHTRRLACRRDQTNADEDREPRGDERGSATRSREGGGPRSLADRQAVRQR